MYTERAQELRTRLTELRIMREANNNKFPTKELEDEFMDKHILHCAIVLKRDYDGNKYRFFTALVREASKGNPINILIEGPQIMYMVEEAVKRMQEEDALEEAKQIING